jgi:hypothetical protein
MKFCLMPIRERATTVLVKLEYRVLAVAEVEISLAVAEVSGISSNHFSAAVLLVNSEDQQVRRAGKISKSLPTFHLNKRSLVPMFQ